MEYAHGAEYARVFQRVAVLQKQYALRDATAGKVRAIRSGDWDQLAPGAFTEEYPAPVVANKIDIMARHVAASLAALPAFNCTASSMLKDAPKAFAEKRTKIANNYVTSSRLQARMQDAADSFNCYAMLAFRVEPDWKSKTPKIRVKDSTGVYPVWDKDMNTVEVANVYYTTPAQLAAEYPDAADLLEREYAHAAAGNRVKVVEYEDKNQTVVFLPECGNHVLEAIPNRLGKCTWVCVPRPGGEGNYGASLKGAYDDLIWAQMAQNEFQMLMLEATDKAVRAPIIVPPDVTEVAFGPDATMRTNNPQGVQRLQVPVPQAAFQAMEKLDRDIGEGGMSPESLSGHVQASVITGKGVEALSTGYSTQIYAAQTMIAWGLELVIMLCFEMDEKYWPNEAKEIRGMDSGIPFAIQYKPSKDIKGDYSVDVTYGFMSGMAPNNALVFILQALSAGLISKDFASRQLPVGLNVAEEQRKVELEQLRSSLMAGVGGLPQLLPQLAAQGQDPAKIVADVAQLATLIKKGLALEDAVAQVFAPPPPVAPAPSAPEEAAEGEPPQGPPGSEQAGAGGPSGGPSLPTGPDGRPDLSMLFAGVGRTGDAVLQGGVSRQQPIVQ